MVGMRLSQVPMLALLVAGGSASCKVGSLVDGGAPLSPGNPNRFVFVTQPSSTLKGTTTVTATGGAASFATLHIDQTGLGYTLGVGIPAGIAPAVSRPFDVVP